MQRVCGGRGGCDRHRETVACRGTAGDSVYSSAPCSHISELKTAQILGRFQPQNRNLGVLWKEDKIFDWVSPTSKGVAR